MKNTSSTNQNVTTAEPNALRIMTFLITSVIKSTSIRDVENQINERIGEYMEIIANNRANNREYIAFKDLKKGDIFVLASDGKWYIKNNDFYAVRLSDGETVEPDFTPLLCEVKDCVLVEREIYTALAEKERV
ncbi:hypothetical protein [uncultured Ruminococcus sp.]|uniref:hypothetical protein n=1 Tax=uncultured Ruminococcus sp. TaxID=165186 RepID=UPI00266F4EE7|nr:hypothetical protein [uncultured Ruminococcus sp.]